MPAAVPSLHSLPRRLLPLGWGLAAVIGLILAFTWGALQVQVALAGFLNGESIWSKAQKQAAIDLRNYAASGNPVDLAAYRRNYDIAVLTQAPAFGAKMGSLPALLLPGRDGPPRRTRIRHS